MVGRRRLKAGISVPGRLPEQAATCKDAKIVFKADFLGEKSGKEAGRVVFGGETLGVPSFQGGSEG